MIINCFYDEDMEYADIIYLPDIGLKVDDLQEAFFKWLFNKNNNHKYWIIVNGEKKACKYGVDALRDFWTRVYGVNMYYFKTLFGDLYLEFGVVGAYVASGLLAVGAWMVKKIKNPLICHFVLYYYARTLILWGIFGFGVTQNVCVDLAYAVVFWLIFSKFWNPRKQDEQEENDADSKEAG